MAELAMLADIHRTVYLEEVTRELHYNNVDATITLVYELRLVNNYISLVNHIHLSLIHI